MTSRMHREGLSLDFLQDRILPEKPKLNTNATSLTNWSEALPSGMRRRSIWVFKNTVKLRNPPVLGISSGFLISNGLKQDLYSSTSANQVWSYPLSPLIAAAAAAHLCLKSTPPYSQNPL